MEQEMNIPEELPIVYTLTLDNVMWESYFVLSKASIGQIIKTFEVIKDKQASLGNETLKDLIDNMIIKPYYHILTKNDSYAAQNVRYHNLLFNLPKGLSIEDEFYGKVRLGSAKIGSLIQCAKDRVHFIINRDIPIPSNPNPDINIDDYITEFKALKVDVAEFINNIMEFEKEFILYARS